MAKAILVGGNPVTANLITPVDCEPGDVVLFGNTATPFVAVGGGLENTLVSFAIGGGIYDGLQISEDDFADSFQECFLSNGDQELRNRTGGGSHFGLCLSVSGNSARVLHNPRGFEI
jgi:hypothetical protein